MNNHLATTDTATRIAGKIDKDITKNLTLTNSSGGINLQTLDQVMELAKMMAVSGVAVRKHLRNNPGVCLAIAIQAFEWEMSPYAVANKSYVVNDEIAYEAQLVHAVILRRAPIKERPTATYSGDGETRSICVQVETTDGQTLDYQSPEKGKIKVQNSPLWKADPDQQLHYYAVRALARRHFPDVILGIYTRDELEGAKDITPTQHGGNSGLAARLTSRAQQPDNSGFQASSVAAELGDDFEEQPSPLNVAAADGRKAALAGKPREVPQIYEDDDPEVAVWLAAYDKAIGETSDDQ